LIYRDPKVFNGLKEAALLAYEKLTHPITFTLVVDDLSNISLKMMQTICLQLSNKFIERWAVSSSEEVKSNL